MTKDEAAKSLIEISQSYCDQVRRILSNHGLYDDGFKFVLSVDPRMTETTQEVSLTKYTEDENERIHFEGITFLKPAAYGSEWHICHTLSSPEYVSLFMGNPEGTGKHERGNTEKPFPPDGLWIGSDRYDPPLDCLGNVIRFDDLEPGKIGGC